MNWRVSALHSLTLVSNSDAHSPSKLGREANLLKTGLSYPELVRAIRTGEGFAGTIEFFPAEGKYHLDGHRACGVCLTPEETARRDGLCPVCGKKLTIGVEHRVQALADRPAGLDVYKRQVLSRARNPVRLRALHGNHVAHDTPPYAAGRKGRPVIPAFSRVQAAPQAPGLKRHTACGRSGRPPRILPAFL